MKETEEKNGINKILITAIFMILIIFLVTNSTKILNNSTEVFVVTNGSLYSEEPAEGYLLREETVLQGESYKNGMVKVLSDGERAAKSQVVFRYYSNSEETIMNQIDKLDEEINEIIANSGINLVPSSDIASLDLQIEDTLDSMHNINYLQQIQENKNKIEAYISKKAQITGNLSPENSYIKTLTAQRDVLEKQLEEGSEIIYAPTPGLASYRIDGLEDVLKVDNFDYLTTELLNSFGLKVGASTPLNNEKGKIVNNFECFIATSINTEKAMNAKVGDIVTIRLSTSDEIDAEIVYIKEEENNRILVFKIEEKIADLLEYRKISFDIIWWKYTGLKISNSCILEETKNDNEISYVEKNKAGYKEKILVKVLRQNDSYSIVINYEDDELRELGYTEEEISDIGNIKLYDEIISY
ncbi:MAG: hypothetical protein IJW20_04915 [Clostridia bacterium]|nr:hypothetical protein [Clostridia bacterium]